MSRKKTPDDVAAIEEAQRATDAAMVAVFDYLNTADKPDCSVAHGIIDKVLAEHDCESPDGHIVACGEQAVEPHERGHGEIRRGEAIVIDIFPRSKKTGFFADMTRTVCIGPAPEKLQKMYDTVLGAQELAISMLAPGVSCRSIQEATEKFFIEHGYETTGKGKEFAYAEGFVHAIGHGVGKNVHEAPSMNRRTEETLQVGDVVTIEPGLYYKDVGGIRIEDLLLITESGHRNFSKTHKKFIL